MYIYRTLSPEEQEELIRARRERGHPAHQPPHPHRDELYYLITAACYNHRKHIHTPERRQQVLDHLFENLLSAQIELRAWVVMTNHYHVLLHTKDFEQIGKAIKRVHGPTAVAWNRVDGAQGRKIWYRYADRAIRSEAHYYTTLNYIHFNPCRHNEVTSPYDWPWSSVHWYRAEYGRDWLRDLWASYPLHDYGKGWDDV
jgi:putative transposase